MRGLDERTGRLFSYYVDLEDRVPATHPLRVNVTPHIAQSAAR